MPVSSPLITLLDDICRADLENFRDWYASCIFWSTLAVVIGCAMEVPEVLHELWPKLFAQKRERLIKIVASIGLGFVVLGVAGELSFEHWRVGYEGLLQNFDNILLVDAESHAALAQKEANDAAEEAGILGVKVDKLPSFVAKKESDINNELARFQKYFSTAQSQTSTALEQLKTNTDALNGASNEAKAAAKEAQAQREAMAAANSPRYLLPQQQIDFVKTLKGFGKLNVQLVTPPSTTPDVGPLASLLEALIKQPNGNSASIMQPLGGWAKYVQVCPGPTPTANINAASATIVNVLNADKIPAFLMTNCDPKAPQYGAGNAVKDADIIVYVGSKF